MMQVTSDQWLSWLSLYFWPLLRVLALISTAPILSERSVPKRVKLGLAMMITFAIAPSLPANDVPVFSFFALLLTLNLALGLLNRMAPQLSIFVIGFPLTLTVGISLMAALMPLIAPFCEHLFSEMFNLLADIISELPLI
ncbi:TPA: flagellar biosynthetic protein FliR [Escherichia coli]|nr:flagellar biosynthetic protein FliR [Escherichia coli]